MSETIYSDRYSERGSADSAFAQPGSFELDHDYGDRVHIVAEPFLLTHLARLCSPETIQPQINDLVSIIYQRLMARAIDCEFSRVQVEQPTRMIEHTSRGLYRGEVIDPETRVVVLDIARAGTLASHVCFHMLNQLLTPSHLRQDHVVMQREVDANGQVTGAKISGAKIGGGIEGAILVVPDPMAATGGSMIGALEHYEREFGGGAAKMIALHLIVTPEYLRAVKERFPELHVFAVRLDRGMSAPEIFETRPGSRWADERGLNEAQYIVPGGGGFGEILNNTEH